MADRGRVIDFRGWVSERTKEWKLLSALYRIENGMLSAREQYILLFGWRDPRATRSVSALFPDQDK